MPTHYKGNPRTERALNTFIKITRASNSLVARLLQRGMLGDLTLSQFGVLEVLYHLGPMCKSDISSKLLLSTGNITLVIDNLEKRSLVRRQRDMNDRRFITISLTEQGQDLISRVFPSQAEAIADEMSALTPEEQDTLSILCRKLGKKAN